MPLLYKTAAGDYLLYSEADLHFTGYPGVVLNSTTSTDLVSLRFDQYTTGNIDVKLPFTSPWRAAIIGSLKDVAETMMIENLSPPCAIADTAWIEPGASAWAWLTRGRYPQNSRDTWIAMIDFAAEIGWKYVTLDDGWQQNAANNTYYPWINEICAYAKEKGVGLIAWSNVSNLNTPAKRERLAEWASMGIKGVKADFFQRETPAMMETYEEVIKKAAECGLVMNFHGSNKPTGLRRTYPNSLAYESVYGAEQATTTARQDCIYVFTKNAIGPMDYTPLLEPWFSARNYTVGHNMGMAICYQTGFNFLADYPDAYLTSPARDLFQNIPNKWDEMVLLGGEVFEYTAVARRAGNTWLVGAMCDAARTIDVPMTFLGDGTYYATIYRDGATQSDLDVEVKEITKADAITLPMKQAGGAAMKITKDKPVAGEALPKITGVKAVVSPSGMNVTVNWDASPEPEKVSRYIVYCGLAPDFEISAKNRVGVFSNTITSIEYSPETRDTFYFKGVVLAKNATMSEPSDASNAVAAGLTNYALKAVSVSAIFSTNNNERAELACDGSYSTKWCATGITATNGRGFLNVKLVEDSDLPKELLAFKIAHGGVAESATYNTRNFDIDYSMDGVTWTNAVQCRNNSASITVHELDEPIIARYVRLNVINGEQGNTNTSRIYEFMALGMKGDYDPIFRAGDKPVSSLAKAAGQTVTADIRVKNTGGSNGIAVYAALYDAAGKLVGINNVTKAVAANADAVFSVGLTIPAVTAGMRMSLFIWSDEYIPLMAPYSIY
jgi:hypothetical protein